MNQKPRNNPFDWAAYAGVAAASCTYTLDGHPLAPASRSEADRLGFPRDAPVSRHSKLALSAAEAKRARRAEKLRRQAGR